MRQLRFSWEAIPKKIFVSYLLLKKGDEDALVMSIKNPKTCQDSHWRGFWVVQSVVCPTPVFCSGHNPRVARSSPTTGSVLTVGLA